MTGKAFNLLTVEPDSVVVFYAAHGTLPRRLLTKLRLRNAQNDRPVAFNIRVNKVENYSVNPNQ